MRKEHKPIFIIRLQQWLNNQYIKRIVRPQFDVLGEKPVVARPQSLKIFGENICAGKHLHIICSREKTVNLTTWKSKQQNGKINIGDYCLISPGTTLSAANSIIVENNCMLASEVYVSDSDWHGIYNRTRPFRCSSPVHLKENVWLGFRSTVTKGVTIGKNSVVGAGAIVVDDVPDNVIVAGNPAKIVKEINPKKRMLTREYLFQDIDHYNENQKQLDSFLFGDNNLLGWLKSQVAPTITD